MMESIVEVPGICRACLASSQDLEPLTTEYEAGYSLKDMLISFCTIHLDDNAASVSNVICKECSLETLRAYNFKLKCERSDTILRDRAQVLKIEDGCYMALETKDLQAMLKTVEVDMSIVKDEQLGNEDNIQEDEFCDGNVKDEDYVMDVDDILESDEELTLKDILRKQKPKKSKKKTKCKMVKIEIPAESNDGEKKRGKPGRKKKPIPEDLARLIDNSHLQLGYRRVYECPKCCTLCKSFKMMHKHLIKVHQVSLQCVGDFDTFRDEELRKKGIEPVEDKKDILPPGSLVSKLCEDMDYKCVDCEFRCKSYKLMKKHILGHKEAKYMHCDECKYKTSDLRRLVRHVKSLHRDERLYSCELCGYRADSKYAMDLHHSVKHLNIKPFVCHLCAKEFTTNQSMMNHIGASHEKRKNHFCATCGKGFFDRRHLKEHQGTHLGLRPHICEHCGATFTQKPNLEKHVLTIHLSHERIFQCPKCPYKAKSIYSLKSHTRRHEDRIRFQCDVCEHSFVTKDGLKRHMWRHMGEKKFKCVTCPYSCYDAGTLRNHCRKHTGERPFPCQHCSYRSKTKERLKNHMRSHVNDQKYSCQHCPYTANYRYNLVRHLRTNCGRTTRNYTPRKNKAVIDISLLQMNRDNTGSTSDVPSTTTSIADSIIINNTNNENTHTLTDNATILKIE